MKMKFDYFKDFEDIKIYDPIYFSILRGCLEIDPSNRLSIEQISDKLNSEESIEIRNFDQEIELSTSSTFSTDHNSLSELSIQTKSKIDYSMLTKQDVLKWNLDDVTNWLEYLNMQDYQMSFKMNEIDGESLLELKTNDEFTSYLKIEKLGHIKKLQKYIQEFNKK